MPNYIELHFGSIQELLDTAAPTSGTWNVGDTVYNSAATPGQAQSWTCTTAGTPGTWTPFVLQPVGVVANSAGANIASTANIVSITGAGGYNLTVAAPTTNQAGLQITFVNASSGTVTLVAGTGATIVGLATVPTLTSGTLEAATTNWYRI